MQEFMVFFILVAAICIVFRHMAPRSLRSRLNQAFWQIAIKMGWTGMAEKLAKKKVMIAGESGCPACSGCARPEQKPGCEMRIRLQDIKKP